MAYADVRLEAPEIGVGKSSTAEEFYRIGLIYANGMDVEVDIRAAHKWFNLAASRGHRDARICRQEMADMMSAEEIAAAQKAAREWLKKAN
jgi:uncharacterized protein